MTAAVAAVAAVDNSKTSALRKIRIDRPKKEEFEDGASAAAAAAAAATVASPLLSLKSPQPVVQARQNISPRGRHRVPAYARRSTGAALGPSVLSKVDAELVVFAVRSAAVNPPSQSHHQEGHSSLKTVIRLPKTSSSQVGLFMQFIAVAF